MAQLEKIKKTFERVKVEYFLRNSVAQEEREGENRAATHIQSWFRGCKLRAYLRLLHTKATIIQKAWRGFAARARLRQMVKAAYFIMKMNAYEEMAIMIQRRWRGFYVRKYIHNFYSRKKYLQGLAMKNDLVRRGLDELEEFEKREKERAETERHQRDQIQQTHRLHHLLSTKQRPGVFNSPFRPFPHEMELVLRQARPPPTIRLSPRNGAALLGRPGPTGPSPPGGPWMKTTYYCCTSRPLLPPVHGNKPQGPFRDPEAVWEQRCRSPELSVRLQSPYTHLEAATKHNHAPPFLPFSKAHQRNRKYEKQLHSSSSSRPLDYGSKHFRDQETNWLKEKESFKTVFTSCEVFDHFGRQYSKAGNIV